MAMDKQKRAEYIEQCQREVDARHAAYQKAVRDHKEEMARIYRESQAELARALCGASARLRSALVGGAKITVAM